MNQRVMSRCVTVTGPPRSICSRKSGITLPLLSSTLPNRTVRKRVAERAASSRTASSAMRFDAPITHAGSTALSVETSTKVETPARTAASPRQRVPSTLVL